MNSVRERLTGQSADTLNDVSIDLQVSYAGFWCADRLTGFTRLDPDHVDGHRASCRAPWHANRRCPPRLLPGLERRQLRPRFVSLPTVCLSKLVDAWLILICVSDLIRPNCEWILLFLSLCEACLIDVYRSTDPRRWRLELRLIEFFAKLICLWNRTSWGMCGVVL